MRKHPYQSSLQFIQRPQLLWNDVGDGKLWGGIQWVRHGPTVPSRLSWDAYQSNIPKPRSGVRWRHGMRRFSEYGNVASIYIIYIYTHIYIIYKYIHIYIHTNIHIYTHNIYIIYISIFSKIKLQNAHTTTETPWFVANFEIWEIWRFSVYLWHRRLRSEA